MGFDLIRRYQTEMSGTHYLVNKRHWSCVLLYWWDRNGVDVYLPYLDFFLNNIHILFIKTYQGRQTIEFCFMVVTK